MKDLIASVEGRQKDEGQINELTGNINRALIAQPYRTREILLAALKRRPGMIAQ